MSGKLILDAGWSFCHVGPPVLRTDQERFGQVFGFEILTIPIQLLKRIKQEWGFVGAGLLRVNYYAAAAYSGITAMSNFPSITHSAVILGGENCHYILRVCGFDSSPAVLRSTFS
jgi:hypothetical protein